MKIPFFSIRWLALIKGWYWGKNIFSSLFLLGKRILSKEKNLYRQKKKRKMLFLLFCLLPTIITCVQIDSSTQYKYPQGIIGCIEPQLTLSPDGGYVLSVGKNSTDSGNSAILIIFDLGAKQFLKNTPTISDNYYTIESMKFTDDGQYLMLIDDQIKFWQFHPPDTIIFSHSINFTWVYSISTVAFTNSCIALGIYNWNNNIVLSKLINGTQLENTSLLSLDPPSDSFSGPKVMVSPINSSLLYITSGGMLYVYEYDEENCTLGQVVQRYKHSRSISIKLSADHIRLYIFTADQMVLIARTRDSGLFIFPPYYSINVTKSFGGSFSNTGGCDHYFYGLGSVMDPSSRYFVSPADWTQDIFFVTLDQSGQIYSVNLNVKDNQCIDFYNSEVLIVSGGNQVLANSLDLGKYERIVP